MPNVMGSTAKFTKLRRKYSAPRAPNIQRTPRQSEEMTQAESRSCRGARCAGYEDFVDARAHRAASPRPPFLLDRSAGALRRLLAAGAPGRAAPAGALPRRGALPRAGALERRFAQARARGDAVPALRGRLR